MCAAFCAPNIFASGGFDGVTIVWNLESGAAKGRLLHERHTNPGESQADRSARLASGSSVSVDKLAFVPTADELCPLLISAGGDGYLRCWDAGSLQLLLVFPCQPAGGACCGMDVMTTLRWERCSATLVVGDAKGRVALWDGSGLVSFVKGQDGSTRAARASASATSKVAYDPEEVR